MVNRGTYEVELWLLAQLIQSRLRCAHLDWGQFDNLHQQ